jgi:hypothetical protein
MSSFVCTSRHFNSIEKSLQALFYNRKYSMFYLSKKIQPFAPELFSPQNYTLDAIDSRLRELIDSVRELNVLCVNLQYKHHAEPGTLDTIIQLETEAIKGRTGGSFLNPVQLLKALQCAKYQIETEHLKELRGLTQDEENSLLFISCCIDSLKDLIICQMEDYKSAAWGLD